MRNSFLLICNSEIWMRRNSEISESQGAQGGQDFNSCWAASDQSQMTAPQKKKSVPYPRSKGSAIMRFPTHWKKKNPDHLLQPLHHHKMTEYAWILAQSKWMFWVDAASMQKVGAGDGDKCYCCSTHASKLCGCVHICVCMHSEKSYTGILLLQPEHSSTPQLSPRTHHALCSPRYFPITFRASPRDGAEN